MADELNVPEDVREEKRSPADAFKEILEGAPAPAEAQTAAPAQETQAPAEAAAAGTGGAEGTVAAGSPPQGGTEAAPVQQPGESDAAYKKRYWDSQAYIQKLHQEKAELAARLKVREEQEEAARKQASQRQLTPEEQEREAAATIERINKDPKGELFRIYQEAAANAEKDGLSKAEKMVQESLAALEPLRAQAEQQAILSDLSASYPEVKNPEFRKLMEAPETVKAVFESLPPQMRQGEDAAVRIYRDPLFHRMLVLHTKATAAAQFQTTAQAGANALATQAAVAAGGGAAVAGAGGAATAAKPASADDQFRDSVRKAGASSSAKIAAAFKADK